MKFIARLMLTAVLAAFAASSVAHAAGSAEMAAAMITSDDAVMEMSDCDPCGDADAGELAIACDSVCGAGGFAAVLVPQVQGTLQTPREAFMPAVAQTSGGLTGPPAKEPPRTLI